ncbi:TetR/AcrR family transcriptional regulator [Streptomyces sp. 7-21]|jgi:AcrR family transcriptional regulator|uniref:TetR/AcrR family transcriptional regulator n=1 Tax=Streptomyces sp. 7-21 TaxID=2802283 RepID=UPI00191F1BC7|nr:TetR family transcriptional regulator [Streptomyces sp. 7-21]MBL1068048.1 TetR family transcriptional regulator [Streptomyces sp. 7-21]
MTEEQPEGRVTRRRRRLSDAETAQRMLDAAASRVERTGLTVSLEHLSFEDIIREAGVARAAVYRRWPYKDLFFSDLLVRLARSAPAAVGADGQVGEDAIRSLALERIGQFATAQGRHELLVELLRLGALRDFEAMRASRQWRTYIALHATFLSLADGDVRREVADGLAAAERDLTDRIAGSYRRLAELFGLRLRPDLGLTFEELATQLSATMRGFVLTAPARPELAGRRVQHGAFGTADDAEWSQPALGIAATALSFLEPDPAVAWDEERLSWLRRTLRE